MPPNVWGLKLCWGLKYINLSFILILFVLILFNDQGMMKNDGLWTQEVEKHLQVKQGNFPNIKYLPKEGMPMLSSKQAWPQKIHSGSMSKANFSKKYVCAHLMSATYPGLHDTLTWYFNLVQLKKCIDEWYNCISQGLQYKPMMVQFYNMWINESMSSIIKHHLIIGHWCLPLTDARTQTDNDDGLQGTWVQIDKCE